jgi:ABC-type antimicrobial peptide transport system permease subunit
VVNDSRYRSLREPFQPVFYGCFCGKTRAELGSFQLEVRTWARPDTVIPSVETLIRRLAPGVPIREVRTLAQDVDDSLWAERALAAIGSGFAAVAALVACAGLYGLLSYTFAQRRKEIGIRMALGATPRDVALAACGGVVLLACAGATAGTAVALWTGRMLSSVLWQVGPTDLRVHAMTWIVLLVTAAAASALPAWRATRIDPAETLREN